MWQNPGKAEPRWAEFMERFCTLALGLENTSSHSVGLQEYPQRSCCPSFLRSRLCINPLQRPGAVCQPLAFSSSRCLVWKDYSYQSASGTSETDPLAGTSVEEEGEFHSIPLSLHLNVPLPMAYP